MHDLPVLDRPPAPLTCFASGEAACIAWVGLGDADADRLRALGLREGACVNVVRNDSACVVALGGCRLALQREVADQLFATPTDARP